MQLNYLITTYNRPVMLAALLNSLDLQMDDRYRVLIADDGSSDPDTARLCYRYQQRHPDALVYRAEVDEASRAASCRYSVNLNVLAPAVGPDDLMVYLCDDVEVYPEATTVIMEHFLAHPEQDMGYFGQASADYDWRTNRRESNRYDLRGDVEYGRPLNGAFCRVDHSQVAHRKSVFYPWPEQAEHWHHGDGLAFDQMLKRTRDGLLHPVGDVLRPLVLYKITDTSVCRQDVPDALRRLRGENLPDWRYTP